MCYLIISRCTLQFTWIRRLTVFSGNVIFLPRLEEDRYGATALEPFGNTSRSIWCQRRDLLQTKGFWKSFLYTTLHYTIPLYIIHNTAVHDTTLHQGWYLFQFFCFSVWGSCSLLFAALGFTLASLGFWRLASGFWLLAFGFWLWLHLALGFWLFGS